MRALELVERWPVGSCAVAVLSSDGAVVASRGPLDQPFRLASVTKLLTACAVLVAVEEGALELDEPAGPPGSTVRHLLSHASGLGPTGREAPSPPARRRVYSNAGFELLGATVEAATGIAFADYVDEAVLAPLGMSSCSSTGSPASGGIACAADLSRFAAELLRPRVLHPRTLAQATTAAFPGLPGVLPGFGRQEDNAWGLGFELRDTKSPHWTAPGGSTRTFGHFGQSGTFVWVDPDAGAACVCLTDRDFGPWAVQEWPVLSQAVLAELAGRPAPERPAPETISRRTR